MENWEHCKKEWCRIEVDFAILNLKRNEIVKCKYNAQEFYFGIPDKEDPIILTHMIKVGKWYVYTYVD